VAAAAYLACAFAANAACNLSAEENSGGGKHPQTRSRASRKLALELRGAARKDVLAACGK